MTLPSSLSSKLVEAARLIMTESNNEDVIYHELLEEFGVSSPFELSEEAQEEFLMLGEMVLGERYSGFDKLKKKIAVRGGNKNLAKTANKIAGKKYSKEKFNIAKNKKKDKDNPSKKKVGKALKESTQAEGLTNLMYKYATPGSLVQQTIQTAADHGPGVAAISAAGTAAIHGAKHVAKHAKAAYKTLTKEEELVAEENDLTEGPVSGMTLAMARHYERQGAEQAARAAPSLGASLLHTAAHHATSVAVGALAGLATHAAINKSMDAIHNRKMKKLMKKPTKKKKKQQQPVAEASINESRGRIVGFYTKKHTFKHKSNAIVYDTDGDHYEVHHYESNIFGTRRKKVDHVKKDEYPNYHKNLVSQGYVSKKKLVEHNTTPSMQHLELTQEAAPGGPKAGGAVQSPAMAVPATFQNDMKARQKEALSDVKARRSKNMTEAEDVEQPKPPGVLIRRYTHHYNGDVEVTTHPNGYEITHRMGDKVLNREVVPDDHHLKVKDIHLHGQGFTRAYNNNLKEDPDQMPEGGKKLILGDKDKDKEKANKVKDMVLAKRKAGGTKDKDEDDDSDSDTDNDKDNDKENDDTDDDDKLDPVPGPKTLTGQTKDKIELKPSMKTGLTTGSQSVKSGA